MNKLLKEKKYLILVLFLLVVIPWSLSDYTDQVSPEKITSDLRFYEINTCKISINEFFDIKSKCSLSRSLQVAI